MFKQQINQFLMQLFQCRNTLIRNLFPLWSVQSKMCKKSLNFLIFQVCSSWEPAVRNVDSRQDVQEADKTQSTLYEIFWMIAGCHFAFPTGSSQGSFTINFLYGISAHFCCSCQCYAHETARCKNDNSIQ